MSLQVIGTNKCRDTRAALRFFRERRVKFQFIDLAQRGLSRGELERVRDAVGLEGLVDTEGQEYRRLNLRYMKFDILEKLLECPLLLRTPVVRDGPRATVGYQPEVWKQWLVIQPRQ
jgi:arsenate reductase